MNLMSKKARVRYLSENIEEIPKDPNRGRLLLTLLYWKVFDGIDIPESLMKEIMIKGTSPETLGRMFRHVRTDIQNENIDEMRKNHEN